MGLFKFLLDFLVKQMNTTDFYKFALCLCLVYIWYLIKSKNLLKERIDFESTTRKPSIQEIQSSDIEGTKVKEKHINLSESDIDAIFKNCSFMGMVILYLISKAYSKGKKIDVNLLSKMKTNLNIEYMMGFLYAHSTYGLLSYVTENNKLIPVMVNEDLRRNIEKSYNIVIEVTKKDSPDISKYLVDAKEEIDTLISLFIR